MFSHHHISAKCELGGFINSNDRIIANQSKLRVPSLLGVCVHRIEYRVQLCTLIKILFAFSIQMY